MNSPLFPPTLTVGEIVVQHPLLARVFERVGIDYCCGGRRTLGSVCAAQGLDPAALAAELETAARTSGAPPALDVANLPLIALADHIEQTHHQALREQLPALLEKADRVATKHGWRDPRLLEVAGEVRVLADDMFQHMAREELILFPLVRELERTGLPPAGGGLAFPIRQMEAEHDSAGGAMTRLRTLTDGFSPDAEACNTHRALLAGLEWLESDLHQHVHKENNVLFPRALALEARLTA